MIKEVQLFILDEDGNLVINKKELSTIKEYAAILNRKGKGSKAQIYNEFLFVYLSLNPDSMYMDLPESERYDKVKEHCGFDDEWYADKFLIACMERYEKDLELDAFIKSYKSSRQGIYSMSSDIDLINDLSNNLRESIKSDKKQLDLSVSEIEKQDIRIRIQANTDSLIANNERILKLNEKYPKALDVVELLYKKMINKRDEDSKIYGGGKLGNRED